MAKLVKANGEITTVSPKNGIDFTLEELSGFVGGYIEIINTVDRKNLIVLNEEGKLNNLPVNAKATEIAFGNGSYVVDVIVGDVLVASFEEVK